MALTNARDSSLWGFRVLETCHFPEVARASCFSTNCRETIGKLATLGEACAELPAVGLLSLHPVSLVSVRVPRGASGAALGTGARALSNLAAWSTAPLFHL